MKVTFQKIRDVEEWQFRSYEDKLEVANEIIKEALRKSRNQAVAFSGGKNSLVVLHMVLQHKPDVIVTFCDTTNEYAETYKFVKRIRDEWNLNLYWIKPEMNFWQCMEKYGFPSPGRYHRGAPDCCRILKEKPAKKWYSFLKVDLVFTGISAFESRNRKFITYQKGLIFESERWGHVRCHPIALWDELSVWRYIEENSLPVNEAYEKYRLDRTGCKYCTNFIGWQIKLARMNPRILKKILRMKGQSNLEDF